MARIWWVGLFFIAVVYGEKSEVWQEKPGFAVINTWPFVKATDKAFEVLSATANSLDAIEQGCNICEVLQCDFTVGYGGSPDGNGETTLDAMIMDGNTKNIGAVAYLRRIKDAIKVARSVMDHSSHSMLAGEGALEFAKMMEFPEESLTTKRTKKIYNEWQQNKCQPNNYLNMVNSTTSCPPYKPATKLVYNNELKLRKEISYNNHDTIGMVVLNQRGHMAAGASSNGATHKIPGRVGDGPIPGAGSYVDSSFGGAAATGDGDIMMRFLPTFKAVENMHNGMTPTKACENAMRSIINFYPNFKGGMVCLNSKGEYGAAGYGWNFTYSIRLSKWKATKVVSVVPMQRSC